MTTSTMPLDLAALAVEIREPSGRGQPAEPAATLASLTGEHQALIARCHKLMHAYVAAKTAAEVAYNQHTLLSAQADEAWQRHREQNNLANQLHEQWRAALRHRQNAFDQMRKLEDLL